MATEVEKWVEEQARLAKPDKIYWCDGSQEEAQRLVEIGINALVRFHGWDYGVTSSLLTLCADRVDPALPCLVSRDPLSNPPPSLANRRRDS